MLERQDDQRSDEWVERYRADAEREAANVTVTTALTEARRVDELRLPEAARSIGVSAPNDTRGTNDQSADVRAALRHPVWAGQTGAIRPCIIVRHMQQPTQPRFALTRHPALRCCCCCR